MPARPARKDRFAMLSLAAAVLATSLAPELGTAADTAPRPKSCQEQTYRQFDFWIGHWDVLLPDGAKAGENRIEPIAGGCALQESWSGRGGFSGTSLNSFDATDRKMAPGVGRQHGGTPRPGRRP
jgi:hypothetical protein